MSYITPINCLKCRDTGIVYCFDGMDDTDEDYCACPAGQKEEFWATIECSDKCMNYLYGYHTGKCPLKGAKDIAAAKRDDVSLSIALGK